MYGSQTFDITQEVTVEVTINDVMENIDHDALADALVQDGYDFSDIVSEMDADDVLNGIAHSDIVSYAACEVDTDTLLNAVKESDPDGLTGWLEDNRDVLPVDVKTDTPQPEKPKPEETPLLLPVISMEENTVYVAVKPDDLYNTRTKVGTYSVFNGVLFIDALGVQFVCNRLEDTSNILSKVAFANAYAKG